MAEFLELDQAEFLRRYTAIDDGYCILKMDQPDCPFLEQERCSVYPVRPVQCRTFPFWEENLGNRRDWKALQTFCPGIGKGDV